MKPSSLPPLALALHVTLAVSTAPAQPANRSQPTAAQIEEVLTRFRAEPTKSQEKTLASVRAAVDATDDPWLRSVRAAVARLSDKSGHRSGKLPTKRLPTPPGVVVKTGRTLWQDVAFPVRQEYAFGRECVVARSTSAPAASSQKRAADAREAELRTLLYGFPPDPDLAVASILRDLDKDRGGDDLARVLEVWHNGDESFYQALDRTAGTEEAVFFYDAMLADFLHECVPSRSPDSHKLRTGLAAAHDALHQSFLADRQYRGLREAIALSLLLPPADKLPPALARYEHEQAGSYSVRQIVALLLADADEDVGRVVELVVASAPPLPDDLWNGYDPLPALYAAFVKRQAAMIERAGHTDRLLEEQNDRRAALHDRLAQVAWDALPR